MSESQSQSRSLVPLEDHGIGWRATQALLWLALPMIGMTVSRMLVNNIDTFMVGQLSREALAAIAPSTLLLYAVSCLGMGMTQAVQTFVSQAEGRGDSRRAGEYFWQPLYIALISTVVMTPIILTVPLWFRWFGKLCHHDPAVLELEIQFLEVAMWSIAPATASMGIENFYSGIRKPMIGFYAVVGSLVTITIANYLLIFGHFGLPRLGIVGSAVATILSFGVRFLIVFTPVFFWRELETRYGILSAWRPDGTKLREIVRVGGPIAMQWLIDIGAWVVFLDVMMPRFGPVPMAAATIAIQCMHLSFMPALGIGQALTTQVGNAIGAGRPDVAVRHVLVARRLIVGYMLLMAVAFVMFGRSFAWVFNSDEEVIRATVGVLVWCALFQVSDALCITYSFALRGAGDTKAPAVLFGICCWGIFVVGGVALVSFWPQLGPHGPWMMCMAYIVVLGLLLWRRFHMGAWRKISLLGEKSRDVGFPVTLERSESPAVTSI